MSESSYRSIWRTHLVFFLLALCFLTGLYWTTLLSLFELWLTDETYSHGFLIAPIALYLVWEKRPELCKIKPAFSVIALFFLAAASVLWGLAEIVHIQVIEQFVFLALISLLVWAVFGSYVFRTLLFPLLFLFFSIPLLDPLITPVLQSVTAVLVTKAVALVGVPVVLDEHFITIPAGVFHVETACAGMRYFLTGLILSTLFAYLTYQRLSTRLVFMLVSIVLFAFINWVRVFMVIIAGHLTDMQHAFVEDHNTLGWFIFVACIVPLFLLGVRYKEEPLSARKDDEKPGSASSMVVTPVNKLILNAALVLVLLLPGPLALAYLNTKAASATENFVLHLPSASGVWQGPFEDKGHWTPMFVGADKEGHYRYSTDRGDVNYYVAHYLVQKQGKELADNQNRLYDRDTWAIAPGGEMKSVDLAKLWPYQVRELIVKRNNQVKLIWQWYVVAGYETAQPKRAKLFELYKLLGGDDSSVAIVIAADGHDPVQARQTLTLFLSSLGHEIKQTLHY